MSSEFGSWKSRIGEVKLFSENKKLTYDFQFYLLYKLIFAISMKVHIIKA